MQPAFTLVCMFKSIAVLLLGLCLGWGVWAQAPAAPLWAGAPVGAPLVGALVSAPVVTPESRTALLVHAPQGAVSYTHLTLPTKRIV